jgi:hypothetical protein
MKAPAKQPEYKPFGDEVYRKVGRKYQKIGREWTGFPADGIWLVQDGMHSMSCLVGLKERVPIFALNYRLHEQGVADRIQAREKEVGHGLSLFDMARIACDYFAHAAAKQIEARK